MQANISGNIQEPLFIFFVISNKKRIFYDKFCVNKMQLVSSGIQTHNLYISTNFPLNQSTRAPSVRYLIQCHKGI